MRLLGLIGVLLLAWLPLWSGLGSHPLYGRSESRYACVAQEMLSPPEVNNESGWGARLDAWLIPRFHGKAHLTKPPMQYWAMAASMSLLGENELAARLPSAVASSLVVLMVGGLAWRLHGGKTAVASVAMLSVLPVFVVVGRIAVTDAGLAMCWLGVLGCGVMHALAIEGDAQRRVWHCFLWGFVALGLLVKGPLALLPAGLVLVWLGVARRWDALRGLRPVAGVLLACVPLGLWVLAVCWRLPGGWVAAMGVWWFEIVDRAAGSGDHPRPWWFLLPVFLLGLMPAVTQWSVPGVHVGWAKVRDALRAGDVAVLWVLGLLSPLVLFTLFSGKLMSYVLPGAACGALLAGPVLMRWVRQERSDAGRLPVGGLGVMVWFALLAGAAVVVVVRGAWLPMVPGWSQWPVVVWLSGLVAVWCVSRWRSDWRAGCCLIAWGLTVGLYVSATVVESVVMNTDSTPKVLAAVREATGYKDVAIRTVGYTDESLAFYTGRATARVDPRFTVEEWAALDKRGLVLLAEPGKWEEFEAMNPKLVADRYKIIGETQHIHAATDGGLERTVWVFVLRDAESFNTTSD